MLYNVAPERATPRGESAIPREWRNRIPRAVAFCSCRLQTHIMFVEPDGHGNGRYQADSPRWQFRAETGLPAGWYCGKEGHYQAGHIELDTHLMLELS